MVRDETVRDSLLGTEAELEKRQVRLTLVEVVELLDDVPADALQPQNHESLIALKHDAADLLEELR